MILLVASSLALLVIYAGVKLKIQTKREALGHLYHCASWFFMIAGFILLICAGACCIALCCRYGMGMMHKEHRMMGDEDDRHMLYDPHFQKAMKHHHDGYGEGCMVNGNCCGDGKCCNYMDMCKRDSTKNK